MAEQGPTYLRSIKWYKLLNDNNDNDNVPNTEEKSDNVTENCRTKRQRSEDETELRRLTRVIRERYRTSTHTMIPVNDVYSSSSDEDEKVYGTVGSNIYGGSRSACGNFFPFFKIGKSLKFSFKGIGSTC